MRLKCINYSICFCTRQIVGNAGSSLTDGWVVVRSLETIKGLKGTALFLQSVANFSSFLHHFYVNISAVLMTMTLVKTLSLWLSPLLESGTLCPSRPTFTPEHTLSALCKLISLKMCPLDARCPTPDAILTLHFQLKDLTAFTRCKLLVLAFLSADI